jgi:hypothetical protein
VRDVLGLLDPALTADDDLVAAVEAGLVQEYPPASVAGLMVRFGRAELQRQLFRGVEVVSAEIQVELLWHVLTGPVRSPVSVHPLEPQITAGAVGQSDELVRTEELAHPGQRTVEARQRPRVGTVQSHPSQYSAWQPSLLHVPRDCLREPPLPHRTRRLHRWSSGLPLPQSNRRLTP